MRDVARVDQAVIGDQQRAAESQVARQLTQTSNRALAEDQPGVGLKFEVGFGQGCALVSAEVHLWCVFTDKRRDESRRGRPGARATFYLFASAKSWLRFTMN